MLNAEERRRLGEDSISPLGAVLKCITALLVLVSIAASPWALLTAGGPQGADAGTRFAAVGPGGRAEQPSFGGAQRLRIGQAELEPGPGKRDRRSVTGGGVAFGNPESLQDSATDTHR